MLTVTRAQNITNENEKLPVQHSSLVELSIHENDKNHDLYIDDIIDKATKNSEAHKDLLFINNDPVEYSIETNWKSGASAGVASKINQLMDNKLAKMIMGKNYFALEPNDSWSQQVVEKGSPLSLKFKFRSYIDDVEKNWVGCSWNYVDLIRFFTIMTTPPQQYNLYGATIKKIINTGKGAVDLGAGVEQLQEKNDAYKGTIGTVRAVIDHLSAPLFESQARGQYTLDVKVGKFKTPAIMDWIVKSFTATPSQQMILKGNVPMPLWVDFDLELETNECLTNTAVTEFFKMME